MFCPARGPCAAFPRRQDTMPAPARKPKPATRAELCKELLEIGLANRAVFDRIDEIKLILKERALVDGKFRENFAGLGHVSVSPAVPEQVTGEAPVISVATWMELSESRQGKLLEQGLVRIEPIVKGAYHGRVDVKLHATSPGA